MKQNTKQLFRSIRNGEERAVRELIESNKELVNCCAAAPPKKDDGQSPLQVALKTGQFAIADFLMEQGANINFMEESQINAWRTPVLHDAIRAAAFNAVQGRFRDAIRIVRKMLELGANPNAIDSYGNNCLMRAILDTKIQLRANPEANRVLIAELGEIFKALIAAGADIHASNPQRPSASEETKGTELERFIS